MKLEEFNGGHYEKMSGYRYFVPATVNRQWIWSDPALNALLEKASFSLGELNSFARLVPDIDMFHLLHVTQEAVISSRIEGTQTKLDEALLPAEAIQPERRDDWQEVRNYLQAMNEAIAELNRIPLSSRLLRRTHEILLSENVRGRHKMPGQFRTSQNWIGGASLKDAVFVPPAPQYVEPLMGDLENFLHNDDIHVAALIRIGIAHYQFETIHPFLDGNGRIGRLLITLYLVSEKVLHQPLLYLSAFFEKNKSQYYDNLTKVREQNDMLGWLRYFLIGVDETAKQSAQTLSQTLVIKSEIEQTIRSNGGRRAHSALMLLHTLFTKPVISVKEVEAASGLSKKAAHLLTKFFVDQGILKEITGRERYRYYAFERYLKLFES